MEKDQAIARIIFKRWQELPRKDYRKTPDRVKAVICGRSPCWFYRMKDRYDLKKDL